MFGVANNNCSKGQIKARLIPSHQIQFQNYLGQKNASNLRHFLSSSHRSCVLGSPKIERGQF